MLEMNNALLDSPLNKHQLELLKLFSRELEEEDWLAIKRLIVQYLGEKITVAADKIWEEKQWTKEDMQALLEDHSI
jgi:hypothetical protein